MNECYYEWFMVNLTQWIFIIIGLLFVGYQIAKWKYKGKENATNPRN